MNPRLLFMPLAASAALAQAAGGTINFESIPNGSPSDQLAISSQFQATFGVAFSTSVGGTPYIESTGGKDVGYGFLYGPSDLQDTAVPGFESQLGSFYLRFGTTNLLVAPVPSLLINYSIPVSAASAQIWDIDSNSKGTEKWRIDALGSSSNVLASVLSPVGLVYTDPASLDGKPWTWSFDRGVASDIYAIRVSFVGTKTTDIGLAFDNFSPSSPVPELPTNSLLALGFLAAAGVRRRARARAGQ